MKTVLLSTSALVGLGLVAAPASAAERIKLSVGGFMEQYVGFIDAEDDTGVRETSSFDNQSDTEIYFTGSTKLDNGITFSAVVEFEADEANSGIDESYLRIVSPTLGELRLGGDDAVDAIMLVQANRGISGDYDNWIVEANMTKNDNLYDGSSSDNNKVSYFSPKIGGFQIGASYTSDAGNNATDAPNYASTGQAGPLWAAAATYETKLSDVGIKLGVSTSRLSHNAASTSGGNAGHTNYAGGAQLSMAGFVLSGGYATTQQDAISGGSNNGNDGSRYQVGLQYGTGPYTMGVWYMTDSNQGSSAIAGDDETEVMTVYGDYALSDGIKLQGMVFNVDYSEEANTDASEQEGGWGAVAGFRLDF